MTYDKSDALSPSAKVTLEVWSVGGLEVRGSGGLEVSRFRGFRRRRKPPSFLPFFVSLLAVCFLLLFNFLTFADV